MSEIGDSFFVPMAFIICYKKIEFRYLQIHFSN